jgi:hypothetical protein
VNADEGRPVISCQKTEDGRRGTGGGKFGFRISDFEVRNGFT